MGRIRTIAALMLVISALRVDPLTAQIDYRNLDDHHPVRTEDAFPIERYAFELLGSYEYENAGSDNVHLLHPELTYGLLANTQLGVALPLAARTEPTGTEWGLAAPRIFVLYNFNTESRALPALSLRADLTVPAGAFGGSDPQVVIKGIATRGWGATRLHLNGAFTAGQLSGRPEADPPPRWTVSVAADRTLLRESILLLAELGALQEASGSPTQVALALGMRWQLAPTLVVDAAVQRRLTDAGPHLGLTLGLTHVFALAGLMPTGPR